VRTKSLRQNDRRNNTWAVESTVLSHHGLTKADLLLLVRALTLKPTLPSSAVMAAVRRALLRGDICVSKRGTDRIYFPTTF
jgi:hypothetical protein